MAFSLLAEPGPTGLLNRLSLRCFKGRTRPGDDLSMQFVDGVGLVSSDAEKIPGDSERLADAIEQFLDSNPNSPKTTIEKKLGGEFSRDAIRAALRAGEDAGRWEVQKGKGSSRLYRLIVASEAPTV